MARFFGFLLPFFLSLTLSACGALNNIYWTQGVNDKDGKVFTVDAKQRHLLLNPNIFDAPVELKNGIYYVQNQGRTVSGYGSAGHGGGTPHVRWRMCAEAAPDVFSAVSSSFAADGGLSADQRFQLGMSIAEAAATIERTQTVNLLRESMYRTCERWLSGAIDQETFITQAARDQRSMVAVLAIEQLTGVVRRKSTVIHGPKTSAVISSGAEAIELIEKYQSRQAETQAALDKAQTDYDAVNKTGSGDGANICDNETYPEDDGGAQKAACTAAQVKLTDAKSNHEKAVAQHDTVLASAKDFINKGNASTESGTNEAGSDDPSVDLSGDNLARVAEAVRDITLQSGLNEGLMFCVAYLGRKNSVRPKEWFTNAGYVREIPGGLDPKIRNTCLSLLEKNAAAERQYFSRGQLIDDNMAKLRELVRDAKLSELPRKIRGFENRLRAKIGFDIDKQCKKKVTCLEALDEERSNFLTNPNLAAAVAGFPYY